MEEQATKRNDFFAELLPQARESDNGTSKHVTSIGSDEVLATTPERVGNQSLKLPLQPVQKPGTPMVRYTGCSYDIFSKPKCFPRDNAESCRSSEG